ncbi:Hypothetical predicted protein [Pelobates cultripes]|uniref:Uncharacterized protein n=1 Tax=Pelobates cultripes TaxID=61616 RepID=A0AAD1SBT1_PELCU|nr:Hypothetical predicted protein [Pelobates cultripes]
MDLHQLETIHKRNPQPSTPTTLTAARDLLRRLTLHDTSKALMWLNQKYYEKGNKADSMLSRHLKHCIESKRISQVRTPKETLSNFPEQMGEVFQRYFENLYNHIPLNPTKATENQVLTVNFLKDLSH